MKNDEGCVRTVTARPAGGEPHLHHGLQDFEADMRSLRLELEAMAARCSAQLHRALDALRNGATEKLQAIYDAEAALDRDEKAIDAHLLRILALRQPLASDLRMVTASLKVVTDLERIGDEAVDLARTTAAVSSHGGQVPQSLWQLAETAETMLDSAVKSYLAGDAELAGQVLVAGRMIEEREERVLEDVVQGIAGGAEIAAALSCLTAAKCLGAAARHATNISLGTQFALGRAQMPR